VCRYDECRYDECCGTLLDSFPRVESSLKTMEFLQDYFFVSKISFNDSLKLETDKKLTSVTGAIKTSYSNVMGKIDLSSYQLSSSVLKYIPNLEKLSPPLKYLLVIKSTSV
jgi:hypothetical protein